MNRTRSNCRRKSTIGIKCIGLVSLVAFWLLIAITFRATIQPPPKENASEFLGKFGAMMVKMLPEDLPFTVFVPSERAFKRHLKLSPTNDTLSADSDEFAIVSRVLGFSSIPRALTSADVALHRSSSYESVSGFALFVSKNRRGTLIVNGVRSKRVDLRARQIVVHLMDGVLMDSRFRDSF